MITAKFSRPASVPAGSYSAMLARAEDCQIEFEGNVKQGIKFTFLVNHEGEDKEINLRVAKTISERGNLFKNLRGMMGSRLTGDVLANDERLAAAINSCVGQFYLIVCSISDKGWTRIESVAAMPSGATAAPSNQARGIGPVAAVGGRESQKQPQAMMTGFEGYPDAKESSGLPPKVEKDELPF